MALTLTQRELFGGAIVADLPSDYIDASNLREIPDHQEVFLSPTTLTSVIIEINEYQTTTAVDLHSDIHEHQHQNQSSSSSSVAPTSNNNHTDPELSTDHAASTHHFLDPILPPDTILPGSLSLPPQKITLPHPSVTSFPAYIQTGIIQSPTSTQPTQQSSSSSSFSHDETKIHQLLIRMKKYDTDLCVRINVPLKEFVKMRMGDEMVQQVDFARRVVEGIVRSLDVREFGLFGGGGGGDDDDDDGDDDE